MTGNGHITGGSGDSAIECFTGSSSASDMVWAMQITSTAANAPVGFSCFIPPNWYYEVVGLNIIAFTGGSYDNWFEYPL